MVGSYDTGLVILSVVVAAIASYVALDLASRISASLGGSAARYWLAGGALSMGTGIWSMHFIGMLAFRLPMPMSYDVALTLLSLLIAVIVSGFALLTVSHGMLSMRRLLGAGLMMGLGIASMHYTGMAAMEMNPPIRYDPLLFTLSIVIAIAASLAALWIAFQLRSETILSAFRTKAGSAIVMGAAISGMHYTGMAAAIFAPGSVCTVSPQAIDNVWLAAAVGGFTFMFLATTLVISVFDARLADRSAKLAENLRRANLVLETRGSELSHANLLLQQEMQERMQMETALRESEERYRQLVELSPDAILIQSEGRIIFVNGAGAKLLGAASPSDLLGLPVADLVHAEHRDRFVERLRRVKDEDRGGPPLEGRLIRLDSMPVDVELTASPFVYKGKPAVQVVMRDITRRKRAQEEIRRTQAFLSSIVDNMPNMVFVKEAQELRFVRLNKAGEALTGFSEAELLGRNAYDLLPGEQAEASTARDRETLRLGTQASTAEEQIRTKGGEERILQTKKLAIPDEQGRPQYLLGISEDITERKRAEEQLKQLAQYDSLTGLPNRSLFRDRLSMTMARARRSGRILALMFLDIDRFKEINDSLGHTIGDEVLQATAGLLRQCLRDVDTIARLGGDEFTIVLENLTHADQAAFVAQKIQKTLADPIVLQGREVFVTASIGITLYPGDAADFDTLLQAADIAMYRAKEEGRNTYAFYAREMNARAAERLKMENLLRHAIERQELLLHYQPKVSVRTGQVVGAEALCRWNSKELGSVPPGEFIPLAEKSGLITPIGEWVLRTACAQNKAWQDEGLPPLLISVNLSPRQLRQKDLVEMVASVLEKAGIPPQLLELEITEGMIMQEPENVTAILRRFHELGVQLSVDDFGTGYSSLAYLKRFPVQKLKIDQSFVRDLSTDADDASIVKAVVVIAKSLGLKVVAEGVETQAQLAFLAKLDCDEYQGYYFSKPVPATEFRSALEKAGPRRPPRRSSPTERGVPVD